MTLLSAEESDPVLVKVCNHAPVTVDPATTVILLLEEVNPVLGAPLHARESEVTSPMNY